MNKTIIGLSLAALTVISSASFAVRYQENVIDRVYFATSAKQQIVGTGTLGCPTYNDYGWFYEGQKTSFYIQTTGPSCTTGGSTGAPGY